MEKIGLLLHGRTPVPAVMALMYGIGVVSSLFVWSIGHGGWVGLILAVFALDWTAGIVANATHSTRAYYAELPLSMSVLFVAIHVAEMPLLWWLAEGAGIGGWMQLILTTKLVVFLCGQIEQRQRARAASAGIAGA